MIHSFPNSRAYLWSFKFYILLYFLFLFTPLLAIGLLAFNDSQTASFPLQGVTFEWFFGSQPGRTGLFSDSTIWSSFSNSIFTAICVTIFSVFVGTCGAFLFEQDEFKFKPLLYGLMLSPLLIPGMILGSSILIFSNGSYSDSAGVETAWFQPGFWLTVFGQFSFITTLCCLIISARLRTFDRTLEEAAVGLGATRLQVIWYIILGHLRPALWGASVFAFFLSFENFNTTAFLFGSSPTLPINLYLRLQNGSTPVINAMSLLLIVFTSLVAISYFYINYRKTSLDSNSL